MGRSFHGWTYPAPLLILAAATLARAQPPAPPPAAEESTFAVEQVPPSQPNHAVPAQPAQIPLEPGDATAAYPKHFIDYAWISGMGRGGFGMQDFDLDQRRHQFRWNEFWPEDWHCFSTDIGFGAHWWEGPRADGDRRAPDLPPQVFDLFLDCVWQPRLADWLLADLALTPGLFTDFRTTPPQAFRLRGHAYGLFKWNERFLVVGGADYINRETVKVLPVGGVLWSPNEDTRLQLVFPYPKVSRRLGCHGRTDFWTYVAGAYGGGAWSYKLANGSHDDVEYNDLRLTAGLEWWHGIYGEGYLEVGYLFNRQINAAVAPDFRPHDTLLIGIGFAH